MFDGHRRIFTPLNSDTVQMKRWSIGKEIVDQKMCRLPNLSEFECKILTCCELQGAFPEVTATYTVSNAEFIIFLKKHNTLLSACFVFPRAPFESSSILYDVRERPVLFPLYIQPSLRIFYFTRLWRGGSLLKLRKQFANCCTEADFLSFLYPATYSIFIHFIVREKLNF